MGGMDLRRVAFRTVWLEPGDYPTLLGVLTFSAMLVIIANLLTDLSYRWIDPRLRGR